MVTVIKKGTSKEEIKQKIDAVVAKAPKKDIMPYAGKLITDIDPVEYQRQIRNEWQ